MMVILQKKFHRLAFISPIYANYANSSITSSANSDNVYKNLVLPSDL